MSSNLVKQTPQNVSEIVNRTTFSLRAINGRQEAMDLKNPKGLEDLGRNLAALRLVFQNDEPEVNEEALILATEEVFKEDFLSLLVTRISLLDWEARKNTVHIWTCMLHPGATSASRCAAHVEKNPELLDCLLRGYGFQESAMSSGAMLREAIRHDSLAKCLLSRPSFPKLFTYIDLPNFDTASDAFLTLKDLLRRHKVLIAKHLLDTYPGFFDQFEVLLTSTNYVTRRQSMKLLGEVLLDKVNVTVMLKYITEAHNLRLVMTMLKDPRKSIQFEAFHVFKVFAANPNKPHTIVKILVRNRERLLDFLRDFHLDKDDDQFEEERELLLKEIESLPSTVKSDI